MDLKSHNLQSLKNVLALESLITLSVLSLFLLTSSCSKKSQTKSGIFKFNLPSEVHALDPLLIRGTAKRFILFNLHRGLYFYNKENKLTAHGAKSCLWETPKKLKCILASKKWSDGSPIKAEDYINTYNLIQKEKEESLDFLTDVESITGKDKFLVFNLKKENLNFRHNLTSLYFQPRKEQKLYNNPKGQVFSGPYKLFKKTKNLIHLKNNEHYDDFKRPDVKAFFVDDPSAALNMYEAEKIDFLRYLETSNAPNYPDRFMAPFIRLDGIFFNLDSFKDENFRKALFYSLNFKDLQKIFHSPSKPGCISLPTTFFEKPVPCFKFSPIEARNFLKKSLTPDKLKITIPSISSNEHQKLALWARENWKKNLGLDVQIEQLETGVFNESVKQKKLGIYRKSVSLKNLTCVEAMENVRTQPEFKDAEKSPKKCGDFFRGILKQHIWLPLGLPSFAHLHSKDYSGYYINMLGQFGLEALKVDHNE